MAVSMALTIIKQTIIVAAILAATSAQACTSFFSWCSDEEKAAYDNCLIGNRGNSVVCDAMLRIMRRADKEQQEEKKKPQCPTDSLLHADDPNCMTKIQKEELERLKAKQSEEFKERMQRCSTVGNVDDPLCLFIQRR